MARVAARRWTRFRAPVRVLASTIWQQAACPARDEGPVPLTHYVPRLFDLFSAHYPGKTKKKKLDSDGAKIILRHAAELRWMFRHRANRAEVRARYENTQPDFWNVYRRYVLNSDNGQKTLNEREVIWKSRVSSPELMSLLKYMHWVDHKKAFDECLYTHMQRRYTSLKAENKKTGGGSGTYYVDEELYNLMDIFYGKDVEIKGTDLVSTYTPITTDWAPLKRTGVYGDAAAAAGSDHEGGVSHTVRPWLSVTPSATAFLFALSFPVHFLAFTSRRRRRRLRLRGLRVVTHPLKHRIIRR